MHAVAWCHSCINLDMFCLILVCIYGISTTVGYLMPNRFKYIYIRYIGFGWVWIYGISTTVGYLMPNPFYTYILDI